MARSDRTGWPAKAPSPVKASRAVSAWHSASSMAPAANCRTLSGEPLVETAVREVAEETGIEIGGPRVPLAALRDWRLENVYEIYPVWRHRYAEGVTHNTEHVFGLTVPRDIAVRLAPREHLRHVWLPWREAADRCFSPSNAEAVLQQEAG